MSITDAPKKCQRFAQLLMKTAIVEWGIQPEALSASCLEHLADYVSAKFPQHCDPQFRKQAIARVKLMQAHHAGRPRKKELDKK